MPGVLTRRIQVVDRKVVKDVLEAARRCAIDLDWRTRVYDARRRRWAPNCRCALLVLIGKQFLYVERYMKLLAPRWHMMSDPQLTGYFANFMVEVSREHQTDLEV